MAQLIIQAIFLNGKCIAKFFFHSLEAIVETTFSVTKFKCVLQKFGEAAYPDNE